MLKRVIKNIRFLKTGINTSLRKRRKNSDYKRWETDRALSPKWDSRTEQIAKLIGTESSVIEFGAGRLVLKRFLPDCCTYTPSDLVDRGEGTIICDLNSDVLPQLEAFDVAVFSGVLEYINNVPRLIGHLSNHVDSIVASYAVTDAKKINRRGQGWVNDYSSKQFVEVFENSGFQCEHTEKWKSQFIFRFKKSLQ